MAIIEHAKSSSDSGEEENKISLINNKTSLNKVIPEQSVAQQKKDDSYKEIEVKSQSSGQVQVEEAGDDFMDEIDNRQNFNDNEEGHDLDKCVY